MDPLPVTRRCPRKAVFLGPILLGPVRHSRGPSACQGEGLVLLLPLRLKPQSQAMFLSSSSVAMSLEKGWGCAHPKPGEADIYPEEIGETVKGC